MACRRREADLIGQCLAVTLMVVQRFGFVELKKSSKSENQVARECAAKEAFHRAEGLVKECFHSALVSP